MYIYGVCIKLAVCTCLKVHPFIYIYTYIHKHKHACIRTYIHAQTLHIYMHIYINMIYPSMCACVYASMVTEMMVGRGGVDQSHT